MKKGILKVIWAASKEKIEAANKILPLFKDIIFSTICGIAGF